MVKLDLITRIKGQKKPKTYILANFHAIWVI